MLIPDGLNKKDTSYSFALYSFWFIGCTIQRAEETLRRTFLNIWTIEGTILSVVGATNSTQHNPTITAGSISSYSERYRRKREERWSASVVAHQHHHKMPFGHPYVGSWPLWRSSLPSASLHSWHLILITTLQSPPRIHHHRPVHHREYAAVTLITAFRLPPLLRCPFLPFDKVNRRCITKVRMTKPVITT